MTNQDMMNAIAGGTIRPNRFVKVSTAADNTVLECNAGDQPIGVTTSSTIDYTSDNHATSTAGEDSVSLQPGRVHDIEAAGTHTRGDYLIPDDDGKAVIAESGSWISLESATVGAVTRALWLGGAGLAPQRFEIFTADETLTRGESGQVCSNLGATGTITLTLPQDAEAGDYFEFVVQTAQQLRVDPGAAGAVYIGGAKKTDNKFIWADDEGESIKLIADGNGDWASMLTSGTWGTQTD